MQWIQSSTAYCGSALTQRVPRKFFQHELSRTLKAKLPTILSIYVRVYYILCTSITFSITLSIFITKEIWPYGWIRAHTLFYELHEREWVYVRRIPRNHFHFRSANFEIKVFWSRDNEDYFKDRLIKCEETRPSFSIFVSSNSLLKF